ncbi:unnamed protein product, partial [Amoebophrya sp. A25]|eukprot:GSA25T00008568001.1
MQGQGIESLQHLKDHGPFASIDYEFALHQMASELAGPQSFKDEQRDQEHPVASDALRGSVAFIFLSTPVNVGYPDEEDENTPPKGTQESVNDLSSLGKTARTPATSATSDNQIGASNGGARATAGTSTSSLVSTKADEQGENGRAATIEKQRPPPLL